MATHKDTYATTSSLMTVRFFGGWDYSAADAASRNPAFAGYAKGVPMGGNLTQAPVGKSPTFLVAALKDPIGANLDRIQVVKGWLDANGDTHETVYDVVWSDGRKPGADGKLPPVGNTVDVATATWTNTIGDTEFITVWTAPDFDLQRRSFYYVRVLEIPTPRWSNLTTLSGSASPSPRARRHRRRSEPIPRLSGTPRRTKKNEETAQRAAGLFSADWTRPVRCLWTDGVGLRACRANPVCGLRDSIGPGIPARFPGCSERFRKT
jgi:hypothetical protein